MDETTKKLIHEAEDTARKLVELTTITEEKRHQERVSAIIQTIKSEINGKIDNIQVQMNGQDIKLNDILTEQVRVNGELQKLQTDTAPVISDRQTITIVGKFIMWMGGIVLMVAAIYKLLS